MPFPAELSDLKQFVVWRMEPRAEGEKPTKVPYSVLTGRKALANDPSTWATLEEARRAIASGNYTGLGFEFAPPFVGIDLDNCRDAETGTIEEWAAKIIEDFSSYTEVSPSGRGVHIFVKGFLPGSGLNRTVAGHKIEMYDRARFFTLTSDHLASSPLSIENRQQAIEMLYSWVVENTAQNNGNHAPAERPNLTLSDEQVLEKCRSAKNAEKFNRLWAGDFSAYGNGDHSAADLALCSMLGFYTQDEDQIDRLFRNSGLNRAKWERADYRGRTIKEALNKSEFYKPTTARIHFGEGNSGGNQKKTIFKTTDLGNAERLRHQHGADFLHCGAWKKWLHWDGARFKSDDTGAINRAAHQVARNILLEAHDADDSADAKRLADWAHKSENAVRIKEMVNIAASMIPFAVEHDIFDIDPFLLNAENGTVDLRTGELKPHSRNDFLTKCASVKYDPSANAPLFMSFLDTIFHGNQNLIQYVQSLIGYSLTGDISEHILPVCYGTGANGKSTLTELVKDMLGDYATNVNMSALILKRNDSIPEEIASMRGARFIVSSEIDEGRKLAESLVKQLTGGDTIRARFLHSNSFLFKPTGKIWLTVNHKPSIRGTDIGIWRRIRLIPFTVSIPKEQQDPYLGKKLRQELSGILTWAVEGCLYWQRHGLIAPPEILEATGQYRNEMDIVGQFIEERCIIHESARCKSGQLYEAFRSWCKENGEYEQSNKWLSQRLTERGFQKYTSRGVVKWHGLGIAATQTEDEV